MNVRVGLCCVLALLTVTLSGCGSSSSGTGTLTSIAVTSAVPSIAAGLTEQFTATGHYSDGSTKTVTSGLTWTSSDTSIATISATGLATTLKAGSSTITATSGKISGNTTLNVSPATLKSIAVNDVSSNVVAGDTDQFTATGTYTDGSNKTLSSVAWSSSDPTVATIDSKGLAITLKAGSTTITASSASISGSTGLTVISLDSISVTPGTSTIRAGSSQSFTATANYSDGSTADVTTQVNWTSSNTSVATINSAGLASALNDANSTTITAILTAGLITVQGTATLNVIGFRIAVSPIGPGIVTGGNQPFTATGVYSDGTTMPVTGVTWSSSDTSVVTIDPSSGSATGISSGVATITASYTFLSQPLTTSTALDVVATGGPTLAAGSYVFNVMSADTRGPQLYTGIFTSDGSGGITGMEDANLTTGVHTEVSLTGSYTSFADGRGDLTLTDSSGALPSMTFRFILSNNGGTLHGKMMEFDGQGITGGSFEAQSGTSLTASSNYVFGVLGSSAGGNGSAMGQVGLFATNSSAVPTCVNNPLTECSIDLNDAGKISSVLLSVGGFTAPDSNGRGSITLTYTPIGSGSPVNADYAFYVVNSNKLCLVQTDPAGNSALAGAAEVQDPSLTHTVADLNGGYTVLMEQAPAVMVPQTPPIPAMDRDEFSAIAEWTLSGSATLTNGETDEDKNTKNPVTGLSGTYVTTNNLGRFNLQETTTSRGFTLYEVTTGKGYALGTDFTGLPSTPTGPVGIALKQSGPFNLTASSTYTFSAFESTESYTQILGRIVTDGTAANASGIEDVVTGGLTPMTPESIPLSGTVSSADMYGRLIFTPADTTLFDMLIVYLTNSNQGPLAGGTPDYAGGIEIQ